MEWRFFMRPCFLVIDNEYPGSISTRKLVLESAKLNVITAYSPEEAIVTLDRFPDVDGVVLDTQIQGRSCTEVVKQLRRKHARIPIVTVSPGGQDPCGGEQYHVSSFDPKQLLDAVHKLVPSDMQKLKEREDEISPKSEYQ
jgi:response regulator RpfG family c-di-GMP phosphodiesterase